MVVGYSLLMRRRIAAFATRTPFATSPDGLPQ
jgi:hypothetical protein